MIDKNNKIISDILLTGNYLLVKNYKFNSQIKSIFDINRSYSKNDKFVMLRNKFNSLLEGFIIDKKIRLYFSILIALDLCSLDDNLKLEKSIKSIKNLIEQHIKYNVKTRFKHFLMKLCLGSNVLRENLKNGFDCEDYLMVLFNLSKIKNIE